MKDLGGRPMKFQSPEELEKRIEAYFHYCDSRTRVKHLATKVNRYASISNPFCAKINLFSLLYSLFSLA